MLAHDTQNYRHYVRSDKMTYYREKTWISSKRKQTFNKFVEAFDNEFKLKPIGVYVELQKDKGT